jgi:hypothetical protein
MYKWTLGQLGKQSQFKANKPIKANSKPIKANIMPKQSQSKPILCQNKANQSQNKPNSCPSSVWRIRANICCV